MPLSFSFAKFTRRIMKRIYFIGGINHEYGDKSSKNEIDFSCKYA